MKSSAEVFNIYINREELKPLYWELSKIIIPITTEVAKENPILLQLYGLIRYELRKEG